MARPNPNSAAIWHYAGLDENGNGKIDFEETMHRTCGTAVIKDDLLYIADFSGLFHCLDAKTGKPHWTTTCSRPLGPRLDRRRQGLHRRRRGRNLRVQASARSKNMLAEINMGNSVYSTPVVANNVLYIANKTHLFAIENLEGK